MKEYVLYCGNCKDWFDIADKAVSVRINLCSDRIEFVSKCPDCKRGIINTRNLIVTGGQEHDKRKQDDKGFRCRRNVDGRYLLAH